MMTVAEFESLADFANKRSLARYDGTRHAWVFINSDSLRLGQVTYAFYHSVMPDVEKWTDNDEIRFYKLLQDVPGNEYTVVCFENFYFLKPVK